MSLDVLRFYIADRLPMLDKKMGPLTKNEIRRVMNAATGLQVMPSEPVARSCEHFLADLKEQEAKGILYLDALPAAMKEAIKIEAEGNST